ncbi:MAG: hypothetical protein ACOCP4_07185 [Candidatus Woesearchaeota archaeon]
MINGTFVKSSRELRRDRILRRIDQLEKDEKKNAKKLISLWKNYKKTSKSFTSPDVDFANRKIEILTKYI